MSYIRRALGELNIKIMKQPLFAIPPKKARLSHEVDRLRQQISLHQTQLHPPQSITALAMDCLQDGVCVTDAQGYFVDVNKAYAEMYGYSREELIGKHFGMMLPEEHRESAQRIHDGFIAGEVEVFGREWHVVRKDGVMLEVYVKPARFVDPSGTVYKVTAVRDVTEEKRLKRRINALEQAYELA